MIRSAPSSRGTSPSASEAFIQISKNGYEARRGGRNTFTANSLVSLTVTSDLLLADADYIDIRVYVTNGASPELAAAPSPLSYFSIHRVVGS